MFVEISKSKLFYYLLCPALFLASLLWFQTTVVFADEWFLIRNFGALCLLSAIGLYFVPVGKYRKQTILVCLLIFGLTRLSPIEVSLQNYVGPPHFVVLVASYPSEKDAKMVSRGEAMLNGCIVSGYEPKWVLVW